MTTAMARPEDSRLAIAETETGDLAELIEANLGAAGFTAKDLDTVKVPSAGATIWTVPGIDGDSHSPELIGVVAHWQARKAYWQKSIEEGGGGVAPDCRSDDLKIGIGNPGGPCVKCPFNQFGSAARGEGKACKDKVHLFMVSGDDILPTVVAVPASSIGAMRQYFLRLVGKKLPYYGVITRLALKKSQSKGGVAYSEIVPSLVRALTAEERERVKRYHDAIAAVAPAVPIEEEDGPSGGADYWRRTAMSRYQEAGGDPADQERCRAAFAAILGCDPGRSRSEYSEEEWAEIAIHYSGAPIIPAEPEPADGDTGEVESLFESEPATGKGRARRAVENAESGTFAQARGL